MCSRSSRLGHSSTYFHADGMTAVNKMYLILLGFTPRPYLDSRLTPYGRRAVLRRLWDRKFIASTDKTALSTLQLSQLFCGVFFLAAHRAQKASLVNVHSNPRSPSLASPSLGLFSRILYMIVWVDCSSDCLQLKG
jgi:hypothetical protein